jgi:hypothetical protein
MFMKAAYQTKILLSSQVLLNPGDLVIADLGFLIHVERAIERMKKFKIIGTTIPLSLKSVATEIVHIIGFLVNYQSPLVK